MIIRNGDIVYNKDYKIKCIETKEFSVHYKGLIFVPGKRCGSESIEFIVNEYFKSKTFNFSKIFGNFFIYVVDKRNLKQYIFTDNSGIFKIYKYKDSISTSFLELVDYFDDLSTEDLDYEGIVEFFHYGFSFFNRTLIKGINRIDADDLFEFENSSFHHKKKGVENIDANSTTNLDEFFSNLIYAIEGKKISVDLTGGFDSRLVLSYFWKNKSNFELALSGQPDNKDLRIASKIAKKINIKFYPTIHSVENFDVSELAQIFEMTDSQIDIVIFHRNHQFNRVRSSRNVDVVISGVGGELYKDFWWLQDFPFYHKADPDLEKLYNYRIESTSFPHSIFNEKLRNISNSLRENIISKLRAFVLETNTQTYDNIYYNFNMKTKAGTYTTAANNYYLSYAPLLELELVKVGFNLKRRERFFNNFHRRIISQNCPKISKIRTTEGVTATNSFLGKSLDFINYSLDKIKRLIKQVLRKILNKTYLQESPTDERIYSIIQNSDLFKNSVETLKFNNILSAELTAKNIPSKYVGKILTVDFLLKRLSNK